MSTTVIASRFGFTLFFAPWVGEHIDSSELASVLATHGLELLPGSLDGNEFIAAQNLSPAASAALAVASASAARRSSRIRSISALV